MTAGAAKDSGRKDAWAASTFPTAAVVGRVGIAAIIGLILLPIGTVVWLALTSAGGSLSHVAGTILPRATATTLAVLAGVGLFTVSIGTTAAWLVTMYRFPGAALLDRLLVLPLAIPTYIAAYSYVELLDYSGTLHTALRAVVGPAAANIIVPELRTTLGAIFVLSAVLYPYVFLAARAAFLLQSVCVLEVARTLGRSQTGALWSVVLPLSRPAIAAGAALACMEAMSDFGAVQYLGVETFTVAIYATWLQRGNLGGAAQLAVIAVAFVLALVAAERFSRGRRSNRDTTQRIRAIVPETLDGWQAWLATVACGLPVLIGFVVPMLVLLRAAAGHVNEIWTTKFAAAVWNSLWLAGVAAVLTVGLAVVLAYSARVLRSRIVAIGNMTVRVGYAMPGTVLALGLLLPLAGLDNSVDAFMRRTFGISTGLLLSGTVAVIVVAYVIRYLAAALGAIEAGLERLSPNLDAAARTLGETAASALWRIHLPLIVPALGTAAIIVFVDGMKELPATILLRPFNFDTLATTVYSAASLEQFETAAPGALAIVLVGLWPVLLLHKTMAKGRVGSS